MLMMFFWVELILSSSNYPRIIVSPRRRVAASLLVYASCLRCDFPAKKSVFGAKKVLTSSALCPSFSTSPLPWMLKTKHLFKLGKRRKPQISRTKFYLYGVKMGV